MIPNKSLMIKGVVTHAHLGRIWYHSEHSDVPYSLFLVGTFFVASHSKRALVSVSVFKGFFPLSSFTLIEKGAKVLNLCSRRSDDFQ